MDYIHLGRSGLSVSRLCLGTMNFGPVTSEADSFEIMDQAQGSGINFFDTANVYGRDKGKGATEELLGRWFALGNGRRDRTVLATKVYGLMGDWPNEGRLSALNIRRACDASLARLQTDHIDLYQMHYIDRRTPWDEIWEAMEVLRYQGKILYVGSSNFAGWHLAKAQEAASRRNLLGLVSEQSIYNLLVRDIELEVLPAAGDYGLGLLAWSPLEGGLLGGIVGKEQGGRRRLEGRARAALEAKRPQIEAYEDFCRHLGHQAGAVALAWLLTRPTVTGPLIGPRTRGQLTDAIEALDVHLDDQALERLDEIFPGPRHAPENYAYPGARDAPGNYAW